MTSTLKTNTIEPEGATTNMVVGETGQNTVIGNNDIRANVLQDAGGNALFTSDGSGNMSGVNSGFGSAMALLSTQTASNSASISFTSDITSTYKEYIFKFYNMNPATNSVYFEFQANASSQSGYNETITSTHFAAEHQENDGGTPFVAYWTAGDQAQGTAYQRLTDTIGNGGDEGCAGELHLFNPSSTTYVKHFYATVQQYHQGDRSICSHVAGYFNFTAALTNIDFKMSSGNIDGKIKMWGVK